MSLLAHKITTTRGRLLAAFALCISLSVTPAAFGKKTSIDVMRSALHISKRADRNANKALTQPIDSKRIKDGAVARVDLGDGVVDGSKLADDAVTSAKIANGQVSGDDLANNSIGSANVADESLGGWDIGDGSIGTADLADDAVNSAKIAPGAVGP